MSTASCTCHELRSGEVVIFKPRIDKQASNAGNESEEQEGGHDATYIAVAKLGLVKEGARIVVASSEISIDCSENNMIWRQVLVSTPEQD